MIQVNGSKEYVITTFVIVACLLQGCSTPSASVKIARWRGSIKDLPEGARQIAVMPTQVGPTSTAPAPGSDTNDLLIQLRGFHRTASTPTHDEIGQSVNLAQLVADDLSSAIDDLGLDLVIVDYESLKERLDQEDLELVDVVVRSLTAETSEQLGIEAWIYVSAKSIIDLVPTTHRTASSEQTTGTAAVLLRGSLPGFVSGLGNKTTYVTVDRTVGLGGEIKLTTFDGRDHHRMALNDPPIVDKGPRAARDCTEADLPSRQLRMKEQLAEAAHGFICELVGCYEPISVKVYASGNESCQAAVNYLNAHQYETSLQEFKTAIQAAKNNGKVDCRALFGAAVCYDVLENHDAAYDYYTKTVKCQGNDSVLRDTGDLVASLVEQSYPGRRPVEQSHLERARLRTGVTLLAESDAVPRTNTESDGPLGRAGDGPVSAGPAVDTATTITVEVEGHSALSKPAAESDARRNAVEEAGKMHLPGWSTGQATALDRAAIKARAKTIIISEEFGRASKSDENGWTVTLKAVVSKNRLVETADAMASTLEAMGNPVIMLFVRDIIENIDTQSKTPEPDSYVGGEIERTLTEFGFTVRMRSRAEALKKRDRENADDDEAFKLLMSIAADDGADLFIDGHITASGPRHSRPHGIDLFMWKTIGQVSVYWADTGILLFRPPTAEHESGSRIPGSNGAKRALSKTGEDLGQEFVYGFVDKFTRDLKNGRLVTVQIQELNEDRSYDVIEAIQGLGGDVIKRIGRNNWAYDVLTMDVRTTLGPHDLAGALRKLEFDGYRLAIAPGGRKANTIKMIAKKKKK